MCAHPGTTGAAYVDWIVMDRHTAPPEFVEHYSEALLHMPYNWLVPTATLGFFRPWWIGGPWPGPGVRGPVAEGWGEGTRVLGVCGQGAGEWQWGGIN